MVPAGITAPLEVIEPQFGLEVAILHLDRPPAACDADQGLERRVRRQVAEVVLSLAIDQRFLTEQPALAATLGDVHAHGGETRLERTFGPLAPPNAMPGRRGHAVGDRRERLAHRRAS